MNSVTKSYMTLNEMLSDRGYDILLVGKYISPHEFTTRSNLNYTVQHPTTGDILMVYFSSEDSIRLKSVEKLISRMSSGRCQTNHCILVYPGIMTTSAKKYIDKCKYHIEHFAEEDLIINIMKHQLMPIISVLTPEEKSFLFAISKIKDSQLPRIALNDPISKYYGLHREDVIKVVRKSETAGEYLIYRICY